MTGADDKEASLCQHGLPGQGRGGEGNMLLHMSAAPHPWMPGSPLRYSGFLWLQESGALFVHDNPRTSL